VVTGPLTGVRVVELASLAPGPFGAMLLADLGADVLRVDRPGPARPVEAPPGPLDRGKRAVAVDLKDPAGVAALLEICGTADVLVEGFRPGVTERLGLGPADLAAVNERLVYARLTGWGQQGPLAGRSGHDINYIALAGALEPIGRPDGNPVPPLNLLGDFAGGGMLLVIGVLAALHERESSGLGQVVDVAMVDGAALLTTFLHGMQAAGLWSKQRGTNVLDGSAAYYATYSTSDGRFMAVGAVEPAFFAELVDRLGVDHDDLPSHLDPAAWPVLRERLANAFATRTRDEWTAVFADADACVTPVLSPWEAPAHPHHRARASFIQIDGIEQPAPAPRFSRTPAALPRPLAAGRDLVPTLTEWGIAPERAEAWAAAGVVTARAGG
jgi:alpha-methylacyl-CoA racemase